MNSASPGKTYYPALDGLRGLAIILVLLYHNFGFVKYFEFGWLGVDLFFVLSGFLITEILVQTKGSKNFLLRFYMRRFLRIFPLYYLCLIVFIFLLPAAEHPFYDANYYNTNQVWFWIYLQNWLYIFKHPEQYTLLNHLWSLAVEEQFYLVWPLVILFTASAKTQLKIILLLLAVVIALRIVLCFFQPYDISYTNLYTFSRIDGLCIGCSLALLRKINPGIIQRYAKAILVVILAINSVAMLAVFLFHLHLPYNALIGYPSIAILFGLLLSKATDIEKGRVARCLSIKPFRFVGKISYSLYIFHWPIYLFLFPALNHFFSVLASFSEIYSQAVSASIATACALLISVASYYFFEKYFLSLKKRIA